MALGVYVAHIIQKTSAVMVRPGMATVGAPDFPMY
jgi:hypothetical protein